MNKQNKIKTAIAIVFCIASIFSGYLQADLVIYEPFDDADPELNGNTSGTGLIGTWSSNGFDVSTPSLSYGTLENTGNQVVISQQGYGAVSIGSALSEAGLLDDSTVLWFSVVWKTGTTGGSNPDQAFAFGTDALKGSKNNNVPISNSGSGIGFTLKGETDLRAANWDGDYANRPTDGLTDLQLDTTYLIVGQITWGADAAALDTINLYLPDTELQMGTAVASHSFVLDQSAFDVISFSSKSAGGRVDEIRFSSTYSDVIGGPADPTAPDVEAGDDWITWSDQGVQLSPVVTNNDNTDLTYKWTTNAPDGYIVSFNPNDTDPTPTITIKKDADTDDSTLITVTLAVNNVGSTRPDVEDTMTIDLYDNGCDAAVIAKGVQLDAGDINGDCITNIEDIAMMAMEWLVSYTLNSAIEK